MNLGEFRKYLAILGYPASGKGISGGGIGLKPSGVLSATGAPFTASGSVAEQSAPAISVPANALIVSGSRMRVTMNVTCVGVGAVKTFSLRLGGVLVWTLPAAANQLGGKIIVEIVSTGPAAQKTLFVAAMVGTSGAATVTRTTVDMTQAQTLTPTITPGNTTDSITIEDVLVEFMAQ
jgi:hypothetical protein